VCCILFQNLPQSGRLPSGGGVRLEKLVQFRKLISK
jgi:hypothetical protein